MDQEVVDFLTTHCSSCMDAFDDAEIWTMSDLQGLSNSNIDELFGPMMGPKNRFKRAIFPPPPFNYKPSEQLLQHSMTVSSHTCLNLCRESPSW